MENKRKEVKDKKVRFFRLKNTEFDGFERVVKNYIHSEESGGLWAYVRHLSEREIFTAKSVQMEETIHFRIAYSPKLTSDLLLEFGNKTYQIVSIDPYEFNKTDLVIKADEIAPPIFDEIVWENYDDQY